MNFCLSFIYFRIIFSRLLWCIRVWLVAVIFSVKIKRPFCNESYFFSLSFISIILIFCIRAWRGWKYTSRMHCFHNQIRIAWISWKPSICQRDCVNTTYLRTPSWRSIALTNIIILFFIVWALIYSITSYSTIDNEMK